MYVIHKTNGQVLVHHGIKGQKWGVRRYQNPDGTYTLTQNNYQVIKHHGILGQKWGKRNGPPYPLGGGDYTVAEKKAIYEQRSKKKNSIYNKRHFDEVLDEGTVLSTLSFNKDRTKNTDMFFATYKFLDKHQYNAMFNRPMKDENSKKVLKYRINNKVVSKIKIASEDSAAEQFRQLYKTDRDFYNFVTSPDRMTKYFVKSRYKFKGYREAYDAIEKVRNGKEVTEADVQKMYRMFNYILPSDGSGNSRIANDVLNQRTKFFNAMSEAGYGALLDVNDAIYGGFRATSPIIVFDMSNILPDSINRTSMASKQVSKLITAGRKCLGV